MVESLRLFHPTRIAGAIGAFIDFFVSRYSTQSKIVGWNKRSGSIKLDEGDDYAHTGAPHRFKIRVLIDK